MQSLNSPLWTRWRHRCRCLWWRRPSPWWTLFWSQTGWGIPERTTGPPQLSSGIPWRRKDLFNLQDLLNDNILDLCHPQSKFEKWTHTQMNSTVRKANLILEIVCHKFEKCNRNSAKLIHTMYTVVVAIYGCARFRVNVHTWITLK